MFRTKGAREKGGILQLRVLGRPDLRLIAETKLIRGVKGKKRLGGSERGLI